MIKYFCDVCSGEVSQIPSASGETTVRVNNQVSVLLRFKSSGHVNPHVCLECLRKALDPKPPEEEKQTTRLQIAN